MPVLKVIARTVLWLFGWKVEGEPPKPAKYVLIAAPHTTNWDFVFLLAFAWHFGVHVSWLGKKEMFRWPFGTVLRVLGGIPVVRSGSGNMVDRMAELFAEHERLALTVPVEGTRKYVDYWKSGFYHIAVAAKVPIVMSYLDYPNQRGGFGPAFTPSGEITADMDTLRAYYDGKKGKNVEWTGRIRLREEDPLAETSARAAK
jgi:1-acyl-sn-glycerol-3-phosphate acyltransferase